MCAQATTARDRAAAFRPVDGEPCSLRQTWRLVAREDVREYRENRYQGSVTNGPLVTDDFVRTVKEVVVDRTARTGHVAAALGLSSPTVQGYARAGRIPATLTPGGQYRFNVQEVMDILGRADLTPTPGLRDLFGEQGVLVSETSAYRRDPITPDVESRLRAHAVRRDRHPVTRIVRPADGSAQLVDMVNRVAGQVAVAVLSRA
jgi:excisionase family DNA binding protein